jgi:hypothetical protein
MKDRERCDGCHNFRASRYGHPYWGGCVAEVDTSTWPTFLVRIERRADRAVPVAGYDEGCPRWEAKR